MTTAVVYPCEASALKATLDAAAFGLIRPVLYGPMSELQTIAAKAELDLAADTVDFVECGTSPQSMRRGGRRRRSGGAIRY